MPSSQPSDHQDHTLPSQRYDNAPCSMESPSIRTPSRAESRRIGTSGSVGCQKTTRVLFNESYRREASLPSETPGPITRSVSTKILERVRELLYHTLKVPRGAFTYTELKKSHDLQPVRRWLEKYFPVLALAENQWAATGFVQEAARRDSGDHREQSSDGPGTAAPLEGPEVYSKAVKRQSNRSSGEHDRQSKKRIKSSRGHGRT